MAEATDLPSRGEKTKRGQDTFCKYLKSFMQKGDRLVCTGYEQKLQEEKLYSNQLYRLLLSVFTEILDVTDAYTESQPWTGN